MLEVLENGMKLDTQDDVFFEESKEYFMLYLDNPLKLHFIKQPIKLFGFGTGV